MKVRLACLGLGAFLAMAVPAHAQSHGARLKDRIAVPAPIPVPAPVPIPEGFTYYLRADIGWGFAANDPSYSESGRIFDPTGTPFTFGQSPQFLTTGTDTDDVLTGTIGFGAYFTPRLRGDLTLDFRGKQGLDADSAYEYGTTAGSVRDTLKIRGTVGLANIYVDLLPRGSITPYVGAGIGFVYNDIERSYFNREVDGVTTTDVTGASKDNHFGLAGALMAGVSFAWDHRWVLDVNYRALFLDGGSVTTTLTNAQVSEASIGDHWEHQIRVGLRANIW